MDVATTIAKNLGLVIPETILIFASYAILLSAPLARREESAAKQTGSPWAWAALHGLAVAALFWAFNWARTYGPFDLEVSLFHLDKMAMFVKGLALAAGLVLLLIGWEEVSGQFAAEFYASLLLIVAGVSLVGMANDLVTAFLALELISIPTYVLLYMARRDAPAQEAAIKYFVLSLLSSALLLYGVSFVYGFAGSTNFAVIRRALTALPLDQTPVTLVLALVFILAGLGFRVTAAPFHFYAPDVFQGAPNVAAALLAYVPKIAGFVALIRLVSSTLLLQFDTTKVTALAIQSGPILMVLAVVTMFLGNLLALWQTNLKRFLAYSSVAHAGYMLVGLSAGFAKSAPITGIEAILFYLVIYGAMTLGVFAALAYLSTSERSVESLNDLNGLGESRPLVAFLLAGFLFSLTGLPPTAGFWGKFNLFLAAWSEGSVRLRVLAALLALNAAIGGWYYLRVIARMYLVRPQEQNRLRASGNIASLVGLGICSLLTFGLFFLPNRLGSVVAWVVSP